MEMSGNSDCRWRQTAPIVCRRCAGALFVVALTSARGCHTSVWHAIWRLAEGVVSLRQEDQPVLADLELVAILELRRLHPAAVDEGPVQAALVLDRERVA